eukprot:3504447-Prymnesium_polylepis.1
MTRSIPRSSSAVSEVRLRSGLETRDICGNLVASGEELQRGEPHLAGCGIADVVSVTRDRAGPLAVGRGRSKIVAERNRDPKSGGARPRDGVVDEAQPIGLYVAAPGRVRLVYVRLIDPARGS